MPETGQGTIVDFVDVEKRYLAGLRPALARTSFSINRGEFFSILGPSGSGKTTALRLIAGFEQPGSGRILIDGKDVSGTPSYQRTVNTVFQSYALFPHMTAAQNIDYPLKMAGVEPAERRTRVAEALGLVAMSEFSARYPHQMSGGQRQRIALARAFVGRPKVLLLDEPLGALDLNLRLQMQHVLVDLQRRLGITFVYVTHDQSEALSMSDRVAILKDGVIQQLGTPADIYYEPSNAFVAQFIGKSNLAPVVIAGETGRYTGDMCGARFPLARAQKSGPARLSLRFEALTLTPAGTTPPHAAQLQGTVRDILFLGHVFEVSVDCAGTTLIALVPARRDMTFREGQSVTLSFNPDDAALFHD